MSDANLPLIIAWLRKVPGTGFQDVNTVPSAARAAVAPAPSTVSYPDHAPKLLREQGFLTEVKKKHKVYYLDNESFF